MDSLLIMEWCRPREIILFSTRLREMKRLLKMLRMSSQLLSRRPKRLRRKSLRQRSLRKRNPKQRNLRPLLK